MSRRTTASINEPVYCLPLASGAEHDKYRVHYDAAIKPGPATQRALVGLWGQERLDVLPQCVTDTKSLDGLGFRR